jgi:hypothetical protein
MYIYLHTHRYLEEAEARSSIPNRRSEDGMLPEFIEARKQDLTEGWLYDG